MVIPPKEEGLKEAWYKENNIIISDSALLTIPPPQLKNMSACYKVMGGCECWISAKIRKYSLLTWRYHHLKQLKDRFCNAQNRQYVEIESCIFKIYKNSVRPHSCHIHNTASDMDMATMCPYNFLHHVLTHWNCVL